MKKLAIAGASLALAAMPVVGVFAAGTDDLVITDTLQITVDATCTFSATTGGASTGAFDTTYAATVANGAVAQFKVDNANKSDHIFGVVCNDDEGWAVTASAPLALSASGVDAKHNISYSAAALPAANSQPEGVWNAVVTGTNVAADSTEQAPTGIVPDATDSTIKYIKTTGGVIATESDSTDGSTFTVTYGAYVGTETPAGTYSATASVGDNQASTNTNSEANDGGGTIDYVLSVL